MHDRSAARDGRSTWLRQVRPSGTTAGERLPALDQPTTTAEVQRVLRFAILNGKFPPGSQLRGAHLAAELGISRAPLREAFTRLEEEGLLIRVAFRARSSPR